jgi:hypothetical protein
VNIVSFSFPKFFNEDKLIKKNHILYIILKDYKLGAFDGTSHLHHNVVTSLYILNLMMTVVYLSISTYVISEWFKFNKSL